MIFELKAGNIYHHHLVGQCLFTGLPLQITNPKMLNGEYVRLKGKIYRVTGTELAMHGPPWREGEAVTFAVSEFKP